MEFLSETSVVLSVTKEIGSQSHAEETQRFTEIFIREMKFRNWYLFVYLITTDRVK